VGEAANRAEEIFHGADSQTHDVERMVSSMEEVARVSERNASSIEVVVGTSREQVEAMVEMVRATEAVGDLAERLEGVLRRFETRTEREDEGDGAS
jgi:methyl-accepting chemotaxis protein